MAVLIISCRFLVNTENEMTAFSLARSYYLPLSRTVVKSGILVRVPSTKLMWRGMHASDA